MAVRVVRITAGVLLGSLLVAGLAAAALTFGGAPALRWVIEHPLSRLAGHQINIDGRLSVRWGAPTRITAERLRVANAGWGSQPDMLVAERVQVEFFPAGFLFARRHLPSIAADRALLLLERSRSGEDNWSSVLRLAASGGHGGAPTIERLVLRDSRLLFHDDASGAKTDLVATEVDLQSLEPSQAAHLSARGLFQQEALRLDGTATPLEQPDGPGYAVDLEGTLGDSSLAAHGTLAGLPMPKRADLDLRASGRNLQRIATAFGVPLPALPDFRGEARVNGDGGNWTITIASLQFGHSDIAGELAVDARRSPTYLRAKLSSSLLDSADFVGLLGVMPPASSVSAAPAAITQPPLVVPATPIATKELLGIDADLSLSVDAQRITATFGSPLEGLSTMVRLRSGRLTVERLAFGLAGGNASLALTLDAGLQAPALNLDIDLRKIDLRRFVRQAALPPIFKETAGTGGGYLHLRSSGHSLRELLERMDGEAAVFVAGGQFDPILNKLAAPDVLRALGIEGVGGKPVSVACLVAQFGLRNGVSTARALMLDTEPSVLVGAGNFNFAAETIYLDLTPHHKQFNPLNLGAPVEVRGTFAHPEVTVSKANVLQRLGNWLESDRVAPPPALVPPIDTALGQGNACERSFKATTPSEPLSGGTRPPTAKH